MRTGASYLIAAGLTAALAACSSSTSKSEGSTSTTTSKETMATTSAPARATLGMTAPDFTLKDLDGKTHKLSDYRGKTVVLEWFNPGCPYVVYAHDGGPLKTMPEEWAKKGVIWLTVNSGAPGKQGAGMETNKNAMRDWSITNPILLDETGEVGKRYEAKTTPHMYVIAPDGTLVYRGALDNAPLGNTTGTSQTNYVENALKDLTAGRKVAPMEEKPYGCSVKYAN
jgi:hypothetical protein